MLVEKEKEVKIISIVLQYDLSWSGKQRKGLARGATGMGCQVSPAQRFMSPKNLTPAVARGGHSWAERKDTAGTQRPLHTGYHQRKQQLTSFPNLDLPLDHSA